MSEVRPEAGWLAANLELRQANARLTKERDAALAALTDIYENNCIVEREGKIVALTPRTIAGEALATYAQERSDG